MIPRPASCAGPQWPEVTGPVRYGETNRDLSKLTCQLLQFDLRPSLLQAILSQARPARRRRRAARGWETAWQCRRGTGISSGSDLDPLGPAPDAANSLSTRRRFCRAQGRGGLRWAFALSSSPAPGANTELQCSESSPGAAQLVKSCRCKLSNVQGT